MYTLKEALKDFKDSHLRKKKKESTSFIFFNLWRDYYDKNPSEEMAVFNVIIAKMALEEGETKFYGQKKNIRRVMADYERLKEKIHNYYKGEIDLLNSLVEEVYSQKHIWGVFAVNDMAEVVERGYKLYKKEGGNREYAFTMLCQEYYYDAYINPDAEKIVFNIIIAKLALEKDFMPIFVKSKIRKAMANYEKHKEEIEAFCKDDIASLNSLVEEVYSKKHIWGVFTLDSVVEIVNSDYEYIKKEEKDDKNFAVFRLWRDYDDIPNEETVVFNLVIAQIDLAVCSPDHNHKRFFKKTMANYEKLKDKIEVFCKDDLASLNSLVEEIYSQRHIWEN